MPNINLSDKAYSILLQRIISIKYKPGQELNEAGLVNDLCISRTPIHAACIRLAQEGLLEFLPKKGLRVTDIDAETIREIHDIRDLIEPYAIRNYGSSIDKGHLLEFIKIFSDDNSSRSLLYASDTKMHMEFVMQTHNKLLCNYYHSLQNQFERISNLCGEAEKERVYVSNKEHIDILVALMSDNLEAAEEACRVHLRKSREAAYRDIVFTNKADYPDMGMLSSTPDDNDYPEISNKIMAK
jgi:DNA-binding GntR family transcriptional regulator